MPHPPTHSESEYPAILGGEKASLEESHSALLQDQAIQSSLENAWNDGSWARYHGPHCEKLTTQIAQFLEVKNVRLCASGTAAVDLALQGANIQPGDEVILAAYDFKSNIGNLLARKAVPVLVELQQNDWQISIAAIQNAITPKTQAIIATHLHGGLVDMPRLTEVARQHQISIIEDACQATGRLFLESKRERGAILASGVSEAPNFSPQDVVVLSLHPTHKSHSEFAFGQNAETIYRLSQNCKLPFYCLNWNLYQKPIRYAMHTCCN